MPSRREKPMKTFQPSTSTPACVVAGLLVGSIRSSDGLIPAISKTPYGCWAASALRRQPTCRCARFMRLSASGGKGMEDMDSSELYADMRQRLEELRRGKDSLAGKENDVLDRRRDITALPETDPADAEAYSGQEMKRAYYEAFWRAKNLHNNEAKFEAGDEEALNNPLTPQEAPDAAPAAQPESPEPGGRESILSPMAMGLLQSRFAAPAESETSSSDLEGLTQMYFLDEQDEIGLASAAAAAASVGGDAVIMPRGADMREEATQAGLKMAAAHAFAGEAASAKTAGVDDMAQPQGLSQMFLLESEEKETATAALPQGEGLSLLREKFGVSRAFLRDLRQVELDHARLAMLAVLLSGVVGAGAGVPANASFMDDANISLSALADVARTPWLDPCVAGVIMFLKALSEGDWRLGKGALAGWADQTLRSVSESGAKVLRVSGEEMRKLAVDMEVKHGRVALGAVVCAMAQHGLVSVGC
ncbi:unnamed protein product [Ascophyllum nodosum]